MWDKFINSINVNSIGSFASILGLILTLHVVFSLRKIRNAYIFKGRIPELKKNLKDHGSNLSKMLEDYNNNIDKIDHEVALTLVDVESIKSKVSINDGIKVKDSANSLITEIKAYQENKTEKNVREYIQNVMFFYWK